MVKVPLTRGYVALVDDEDADRVLAHKWSAHITKKGKVYAHGSVAGKTVTLHRFLMQPQSGEHVDHRDGDGLNNCRSNLRPCSPRQNARNVSKRKRNQLGTGCSSEFVGVSRIRNGTWTAMIGIATGRSMQIGTYATEHAAAAAFNVAAQFLRGDFAKLNPVPDIHSEEEKARIIAKVQQGPRNPKGPYPGVSRASANRWRATRSVNGKTEYVGMYPTPEAARDALEQNRKLTEI